MDKIQIISTLIFAIGCTDALLTASDAVCLCFRESEEGTALQVFQAFKDHL